MVAGGRAWGGEDSGREGRGGSLIHILMLTEGTLIGSGGESPGWEEAPAASVSGPQPNLSLGRHPPALWSWT